MSQITSHRQLWTPFSAFWESGRKAATADTVAAISGLKAGGATGISVCQIDGALAEFIIAVDALPEPATWLTREELSRDADLQRTFDALFMLGGQARCGTPDAFMSHTAGINLRVAIDGQPVTDVHLNGWRTQLPLLGVVGDASLEAQLDGVLEGVPFLAVKQSLSRMQATPLHPADKSSAAIEAFASWCMQQSGQRSPLPLPERFVLSISMMPQIADLVDGQHGLRRTSPGVVARSVTDWWYEAEPAIDAAAQATLRPLREAGDDERQRQMLEHWAAASEPGWIM